MPISASPHSRLSSPNELSQPSPLPKALPLPAAGLFCIPSVLVAVKLGSTGQDDPLSSVFRGAVGNARHENGPSTTFNPIPPTTPAFHEKLQAFYLRFCFCSMWHGRGWAVKRSRWAHFVAGRSCAGPLRLLSFGFSLGGYTSFRIKRRTEEVSKCRITGQYKKEARTRWLMGVLSR